MGHVIAAWFAHLYTASGVVFALFAAQDIFQYRYREAFFWLALQVVVDATDGVLARWARVSEFTPQFDGGRLDDIVDFVAYVFVPTLFVWRSLIVPDAWMSVVCSAMLLSSAYGFSRTDAKTTDHFFTGFPSYWNIAVFYLLLGGFPPVANGVVLLGLAAMVFVPVRYVYPSRTVRLRAATLTLGVAWAGTVGWMIWRMPGVPRQVYWLSMVFPMYYVVLSMVLSRRRAAVPGI